MNESQHPICTYCKHLKNKKNLRTDACKAFPHGIPDEIFFDAFDHRKPFPGDNGVRFEPSNPKEWEKDKHFYDD